MVLGADAFANASETTRLKSKRFKDEAFIFLHGYNTTFDDAVFRTAQIAYDLEFDGVPYLFSWPSLGNIEGYIHDRDAADGAQRYFIEFLELIRKRTKARKLHVIAHSMGTRLVTDALHSISSSRDRIAALGIDQLILAAPDIDVDVFRERAQSVTTAARSVTVYAAHNDKALQVSRTVAAGRVRLGDVTERGPAVLDGIDSIDITHAGFSSLWSLNHSTFATRSHILKDIQLLLREGVRPPDGRLPIYARQVLASGATYWQYIKN